MPRELQFDLAKSVAQEYLAAQEEERAASQLRQPDLTQSNYPPEDPTDNMNDVRPRAMGMNLVPERQINWTVLRGEQDNSNK